jgi:xanthine dehydrogenase accessory factor
MNFSAMLASVRAGGSSVVCTALEGPQAGESTLRPDLTQRGCQTVEGVRCYVEEYAPPPLLTIVGAGHVGTAVAHVASFVGFEVMVIDPREELLDPARFPAGTVLRAAPYEDLSPALPQAPCYYLVTTSGHLGDYASVAQLLRRPNFFLGMLGSRRKSALVRQWLQRDGFTPAEIEPLHAPVGLDLGDETPEEIAISIVGQLISVRSGHSATHLPSDLMAQLSDPACQGVLVTVISKKGSTPRGPGSKLLVRRDGTCCGTVGGGIVEYESIELARTLRSFTTRTFHSGSGEAGVMACGGSVEVMFQVVG